MIPQSFGLLRTSFPREEMPKVFGIYGPVMGSAAMVGPILGGGLVSLHLFHDAWRPVFLINLPIGALVLMLYFGAMIGSSLALTLLLQIGQGFSAIHASLTMVPLPLGTAVTAPLAVALITKYGGRILIQIGTVVTVAGYVGVALIASGSGHISTWALVGPLLVEGLGMGFFVVCAFNTILAAVTDTELGSASPPHHCCLGKRARNWISPETASQ
jgi:MFS family permease